MHECLTESERELSLKKSWETGIKQITSGPNMITPKPENPAGKDRFIKFSKKDGKGGSRSESVELLFAELKLVISTTFLKKKALSLAGTKLGEIDLRIPFSKQLFRNLKDQGLVF